MAARKPRDYHHGDLRKAVLAGAFAELKRRGLRGLTLREVARKIGVTHAAPYHHFKDRDALLDAMAAEAFDELDGAMAAAKAHVHEPAERLRAIGRAYIDYARRRPERLEVMFRRAQGKSVPYNAELGACAFQHLVDAVLACQAAGVAPAGDPYRHALSAWSVVHGFATLWIEGPLPHMEPYGAHYDTLRDALLADFTRALGRGA